MAAFGRICIVFRVRKFIFDTQEKVFPFFGTKVQQNMFLFGRKFLASTESGIFCIAAGVL
jgi:hypothetical protein